MAQSDISLVTLPTEILTRIVELTMPSGFESLLLAGNHRIYACGAPFIAAHNQRKKTWRRLFLQHHEDLNIMERAGWALDFVYAVAAKDPLIPLYVEELELGHNLDSYIYERDVSIARDLALGLANVESDASVRLDGERHWQWQWQGNEWLRNDPTALQKMRDLIEGSPRLRAAGVDAEEWADKMLGAEREGDGSRLDNSCPLHTFFFVLTLMDNLQRLEISAWPWADDLRRLEFIFFRGPMLLEDEGLVAESGEEDHAEDAYRYDELLEEHLELAELLLYLVREANNCYNRQHSTSDPNPPAALSRLREFRQTDEWPGNMDKRPVPLRCYSPFLSLHSLEVFSAAHATAFEPRLPYFCSPIFQPCRPPGSSLRQLDLPYGYVSPASLNRLLVHVAPRLESFSYQYMDYRNLSPACAWDVGTIVPVLERTCGETLTSLSLSVSHGLAHFGVGCEPITSLRGLANLRELKVDNPVFLRGNAVTVELMEAFYKSLDEAPQNTVAERFWKSWWEQINGVRPLRDVLPSSLRHLNLTTTEHTMMHLMTGTALLKALLKDFDPSSTALGDGAGLDNFTIQRITRHGGTRHPDTFADFVASIEVTDFIDRVEW